MLDCTCVYALERLQLPMSHLLRHLYPVIHGT